MLPYLGEYKYHSMRNFLVLALVAVLTCHLAHAQSLEQGAPEVSVAEIYAPLSIEYAALQSATTLGDLNRQFDAGWIRSYLDVELTTVQDGSRRSTHSKSDRLTEQQLEQLAQADFGSIATVAINYVPENTLRDNPPREHRFSFTVRPETSATYAAGEQALTYQLQRQILPAVPAGLFGENDVAAITFLVNAAGQVVEPAVYTSSGSEEVDRVLLDAVRGLSDWNPARYSDGTATAQTFSLLVGNPRSCLVNLLGVERVAGGR